MKNEVPETVGHCIALLGREFAESDLFFGHGTDHPDAEAQWLVCSVLTQQTVEEITAQTPVSPQQWQAMAALAQRRIAEKIPLAYLLREAWFYGHCFYVDERVLVPRSPIAELIDNGFEPLLDHKPATILDLCCGGGCIGIACALAFPGSQVILADLSADALAVARINIERFGLADRVQTRQSDLFDDISGQFDLVVSNPPYVPAAEYRELPAEYRHEPEMGLVSDQEGLAIPSRILAQADVHLAEDGLLVLETGYTWPALDAAFPNLPFLWLDFEHGGEGVCALTREQLVSGKR